MQPETAVGHVNSKETMTQKIDRRVQRTQQQLSAALIALTLEKGYEAVSIRDITQRAGVGYATFFRHYKDKDALLIDVLTAFIQELKQLLAQSAEPSSAAEGALIFTHVHQQRDLYRILLRGQGTQAILAHIQEITAQELLAAHTPQPNSPVPPEIAAHHVAVAAMALIKWWLDHDMPYAPQQMGVIYSELIMRPTQAVAFIPAPA